MKKTIGIFGGSFDPVHRAHILLARAACEQLHLDKIIFVLAHQAPLRDSPTHTSDEDRLAMLKLALSDFPYAWEISDFELKRGGTGYSIDTANFLISKYSDCNWYWIIGADHLSKLAKWKDIEILSELLTFAYAARKGFDATLDEVPSGVRLARLEFDALEDSSTFIRDSLSNASTHLMLDNRVIQYILNHKLYAKDENL